MAEIFEAENSDSGTKTSRKQRSKPKKKFQKTVISDSGDENFSASSEEPSDDSDNTEKDSDVMEITNEEVHKSTSPWYIDWIIFVARRHPTFENHPI